RPCEGRALRSRSRTVRQAETDRPPPRELRRPGRKKSKAKPFTAEDAESAEENQRKPKIATAFLSALGDLGGRWTYLFICERLFPDDETSPPPLSLSPPAAASHVDTPPQ